MNLSSEAGPQWVYSWPHPGQATFMLSGPPPPLAVPAPYGASLCDDLGGRELLSVRQPPSSFNPL